MRNKEEQLTLQEIKDTIAQFRQINYNHFTLEVLGKVASSLDWGIDASFRIVDCGVGYGDIGEEDGYSFAWFIIPLCFWVEIIEIEPEKMEAYQLWRQEYDSYYEQIKQLTISILGLPDFSAVQGRESYQQAAWRMTNGVMYLYQDYRDLWIGIDIGLFFEPLDSQTPIKTLIFWP